MFMTLIIHFLIVFYFLYCKNLLIISYKSFLCRSINIFYIYKIIRWHFLFNILIIYFQSKLHNEVHHSKVQFMFYILKMHISFWIISAVKKCLCMNKISEVNCFVIVYVYPLICILFKCILYLHLLSTLSFPLL